MHTSPAAPPADPAPPLPLTSGPVLGYTLLRALLGIAVLMHGLTILLGDYGGFVQSASIRFQSTLLPDILVRLCGRILPIAETLIGASLILGWFTRVALVALGLLLCFSVFGNALLRDGAAIAPTMIHGLLAWVLLTWHPMNRCALDARQSRQP